MRRSNLLVRSVAIVAVLAAAASLVACGPSGEASERPSLVLILADDLGWADVGFQGSRFHRTPALDRLASESRVFTHAYAASPVCSPSRAALLTGLHPARLQLTAAVDAPLAGAPGPATSGPASERVWEPIARDRLPDDAPLLARRLSAAGYRTALIGKLHLRDDPSALGFDVARGWSQAGVPRSYFPPYGLEDLPDGPPEEYLTDRLTDEAIAFVEEARDAPFFLFLSHYAPHSPFEAPAETIARYTADVDPTAPQHNPTYAAMIEHLDRGVARLLDALDAAGIRERTLVVFTSDNGGWEERRASNGRPAYHVTSNAPLRSGKGRVYEGGVRVPLVVSGPGVVAGTTTAPVTGVDLVATFLARAGVDLGGARHPCDGLDLDDLLDGSARALSRDALVVHFPHQSLASSVRVGDEKLIHFWIRDRDELYDLGVDPGEEHDLAADAPERARALRARLFAELDALDAVLPTPNPALERDE